MNLALISQDRSVTDAQQPIIRAFRRDEHAPQAARNFTDDALRTSGASQNAIDTAVLLVSELATNAYRYAHRGQITVEIAIDGKHIEIAVIDAGRSRADVALSSTFDENSESGRGWFLVDMLADTCGIERIRGGNGNRSWFVISDGSPE